jgi:cruciform cutting endonuclease 1
MANPMLSALKAQQLKRIAFLTGLPATGTKAEVLATVQRCIESARSKKPDHRIVSVDMGVRNLAHCVVDVPVAGRVAKYPTVTAWSKMDLLRNQTSLGHVDHLRSTSPETNGEESGDTDDNDGDAEKTAFTPSVLSKTAFKVATMLLQYKPDAILIERQRFRSGGGSAIQEWTVRVNMLESMLWASLQTMRGLDKMKAFPDVHEVNPQRVAHFWAGSEDVALRPGKDLFDLNAKAGSQNSSESESSPRKKMLKKDKVAIVRSWVGQSFDNDRKCSTPQDVALDFRDEGLEAAYRFRPRDRRSKKQNSDTYGKLDDLADCLLQAVTWLRWQENQAECVKLLQEYGG